MTKPSATLKGLISAEKKMSTPRWTTKPSGPVESVNTLAPMVSESPSAKLNPITFNSAILVSSKVHEPKAGYGSAKVPSSLKIHWPLSLTRHSPRSCNPSKTNCAGYQHGSLGRCV